MQDPRGGRHLNTTQMQRPIVSASRLQRFGCTTTSRHHPPLSLRSYLDKLLSICSGSASRLDSSCRMSNSMFAIHRTDAVCLAWIATTSVPFPCFTAFHFQGNGKPVSLLSLSSVALQQARAINLSLVLGALFGL